MARAERPLDPDADPVQAFAAELRRLREQAGRPTYQALARRAHRSSSSLSEAAGGRRLPTLDTTLAYVRALGGDEAAWARRWRQVAAAAPAAGPGTGIVAGAAGPPAEALPPPAPVDRSRRRLLLPAAGAGLLLALVVGLASLGWRSADRPPPAPTPPAGAGSPTSTGPAPAVEVRDGADPKDAGCAADPAVATVDSAAVLVDERVVGMVELRYSPACGASWPRFMPAPAGTPAVPRPARVVLTVTDGDAPARSRDFTIDYAGISSYGNLLTSTRSCVWAEVRITGDGWTSPPGRTGCYRGATQVRPIP
ncbi:helix-turn-helix domain-containing protein [Micromonospora sp. WMMD956]|uniref:helix-turn-helix domain-containing protein n=1 Tax=Micromonospora sp. WMMD956 TaxID=3016108 RepID=UPI002415E16B|nr:XRE family transcriptional regulator [Micromonospora sp. WMMD956]MDG4817832.1 helix-turn-helix domain-containing protein [Micromonospora sp. WMMD956]